MGRDFWQEFGQYKEIRTRSIPRTSFDRLAKGDDNDSRDRENIRPLLLLRTKSAKVNS